MIWHIFKKDLRLLWPMAAIVSAVHVLNAVLLINGGGFARSSTEQLSEYGWISNNALPGVSLLGLVILVIAAIQQDRLPGATQDWLTRPIPRGQLFAAKGLFIVLAGLLPILLADLAMGMAEHFGVADVIAASLTRSAVMLCLVCLPAVLIGVVTRSLTEALVFAVAIIVLLILELIAALQSRALSPVMQSGYSWTVVPIVILLNIGALSCLLPLQIRWRSGNRVRWILAAYVCVLPAVFFLPWGTAFQIDRAFGSRDALSPEAISLDATRQVSFTPTVDYGSPQKTPTSVLVRVPIAVVEQRAGNPVFVDRVTFRARSAAGGGFSYEDISNVTQPGYLLGRSVDTPKRSEVFVSIPIDTFTAMRAGHARIEVDVFATKFRLAAEKSMNSLVGGSLDDHGRCYERTDSRLPSKSIYCVSPRPVGNCFEIYDPARRSRRQSFISFYSCSRSYAPWPLPLWRDPYYSVVLGSVDLWRRMAGVEAGSDNSDESKLIVADYVPDVHFTRTIEFQIDGAVERPANARRSVDGVGHAARFASPTGMVADRHGNLFVVDQMDNVIRKVTPAGEVSTFAGAAQEKGRNDGPGQYARFNRPQGIAIDSADDLFVADTGNGVIRKITPAGAVSTIVVSDSTQSDEAPVRFKSPTGIVSTSDGTLYVIDHIQMEGGAAGSVVRKIAPNGVVSNLAGPGDHDDGVGGIEAVIIESQSNHD